MEAVCKGFGDEVQVSIGNIAQMRKFQCHAIAVLLSPEMSSSLNHPIFQSPIGALIAISRTSSPVALSQQSRRLPYCLLSIPCCCLTAANRRRRSTPQPRRTSHHYTIIHAPWIHPSEMSEASRSPSCRDPIKHPNPIFVGFNSIYGGIYSGESSTSKADGGKHGGSTPAARRTTCPHRRTKKRRLVLRTVVDAGASIPTDDLSSPLPEEHMLLRRLR